MSPNGSNRCAAEVGGVLGGRTLVAMDFHSGLAVAMRADRDGDANDVKFVPELLPEVRRRFAGPRLWMADRQFADLVQTAHFTQEGDHFLVRYNKKLHFHADASRKPREGCDALGRKFVEDWGWIGGPKDKRRREVRRITLLASRRGGHRLVDRPFGRGKVSRRRTARLVRGALGHRADVPASHRGVSPGRR